MATRVFVLEDSPDRQRIMLYFFENEHGEDVEITLAETAEEAKKILGESDPFDFIYLNHDLGGETYVDSNDPNTGYQVALFIRDTGVKFGRCIIHTMNSDAGRRMGQVLKECGRVHIIPVIWLITREQQIDYGKKGG